MTLSGSDTSGSGADAGPGTAGASGVHDPEHLLDLPQLDGVLWSAQVRDLGTDEVLAEHTPGQVLRTASVGKVFLLLEVARELVAGELDPAERISWTEDDLVADSGMWHRLDQRDLTVRDLCRLVGAVSDNLATNVLLRRVGIDRVTALTQGLGVRRSALLDRVRTERTPDVPPTLSRGCADDWATLMVRLARGTLVSEQVSGLVGAWLSGNADQSMVGGGFDCDPLAHAEYDRGIWLANKTGTIATARIDAGFVVRGTPESPAPPRPDADGLAWFVGANWPDDASATGEPVAADPRDEVLAAMQAVGRRLAARVSASH